MRTDDVDLAQEIASSLGLDDPMRGQRSDAKLFASVLVGLLGALRRSPRLRVPADDAVVVIINNPVEHGARLAAALIDASPAPGSTTVLADTRHADRIMGDHIRDLPGVTSRAIQQFGSWGRLSKAARLRRSVALRRFVQARPNRLRAEVAVLAQSLRYLAALEYPMTSTKLVLTDFDRGTTARPWVWAARRAGVRVVTAVHGSPAGATYLPLLATDVLVWGEVQAEWFASNAPGSIVHAVGRPEIAETAVASAVVDRVVICHSREELTDYEQESLLALVADAVASGLSVVIRKHPSEHGHLGGGWEPLEARCTVEDSTGTPLHEYLRSSDIVVGVVSTALVDALIGGYRSFVVASPARPLPADLKEMTVVTGQLKPSEIVAWSQSTDAVDVMARLSRRIVCAVGAKAADRTSAALRVTMRSPSGPSET